MEASPQSSPMSPPSIASPPGAAPEIAKSSASESMEMVDSSPVAMPVPASTSPSDATTKDGTPNGEDVALALTSAATIQTKKRVAAKTLLVRRPLHGKIEATTSDVGDTSNTKKRKSDLASGAVGTESKKDDGVKITVADQPQDRSSALNIVPSMNIIPQNLMFQQHQQYYYNQQLYAQQMILHQTMMASGALGAGHWGSGGMMIHPQPPGGQQNLATLPMTTPTKAAANGKAPKTQLGGANENIGGTVKAKEVWSGLPDEKLEGGWPDGWVKKTFERRSGKTAGTKDSYWYSPVNKFKLRSLTEVKKFLAALTQCNGDESLARKILNTQQLKKKDQKETVIAVKIPIPPKTDVDKPIVDNAPQSTSMTIER